MTGFGDATCELQGMLFALEMRSLNSRYLKATIRLPDELAIFEAELEAVLRKKFSRGTITLNISFKNTSASAAYALNEAALQKYLSSIQNIYQKTKSLNTALHDLQIDLAALLSLPGVVQPPSSTDLIELARPILHDLLDQASDKLTQMREREGQGLLDDLLAHQKSIAEQLAQIELLAPQVIDEYHSRLQVRIRELMARAELKVNEVDLIREVAVFADRSDISEETQRLRAHLEQFEQLITSHSPAPIGRTLDFLAQELLREANTIASKSNSAPISRIIVEIKGTIDRIKEQVQNVE